MKGCDLGTPRRLGDNIRHTASTLGVGGLCLLVARIAKRNVLMTVYELV